MPSSRPRNRGAALGNVGAGGAEPASPGGWDLPTAIEPRVLLVEDLAQWPDEKGVEEMALLDDESMTHDQGLTAVSGDQACDLLLNE